MWKAEETQHTIKIGYFFQMYRRHSWRHVLNLTWADDTYTSLNHSLSLTLEKIHNTVLSILTSLSHPTKSSSNNLYPGHLHVYRPLFAVDIKYYHTYVIHHLVYMFNLHYNTCDTGRACNVVPILKNAFIIFWNFRLRLKRQIFNIILQLSIKSTN